MNAKLINWSRIAPGVYVGRVTDDPEPEPRFEIRRKVYDLPRIETAWRLYDKGAQVSESEQLAFAKEWAEDMIADEIETDPYEAAVGA